MAPLLQFDVTDKNNGSGTNAAKRRLAAVKERLKGLLDPRHVLLRDKLAFLLGSCQLW